MDQAKDHKKDLRHQLLWIMALLGVLVLGVLSGCMAEKSNALSDTQLATVITGTLNTSVNTIGVLDAARTHMVSSAIGGDKGKIIFLIADGTLVEKNDVLVQFDPTPFESEIQRIDSELNSLEATVESAEQMVAWEQNQSQSDIRTAEFNFKVAQLELRRLSEGDGPLQLAQYEKELDQAADEHQRYQAYISDLNRLKEQGYTNPNELTLSQQKVAELSDLHQNALQRYTSYKEHVLPTLLEAAQAKVDKAKNEIQQVRKGSAFKVARAQAVLKELVGKQQATHVAYTQALAELKKTTLRAPFGGIAILYETFRDGQKRKPRVGDLAWQNQPLLYLPDISVMIVHTRIREVDLHKVTEAQPCTIRVDAYPHQRYSGRVTTVGALASERLSGGRGEKYFELTITVSAENHRLRPGMTARVTIEASGAEPMLLVPVHAVFDDGNRHFCFVAQPGDRFQKKQVAMGSQNEDLVEIVSGLREGDRVSLVRPSPDQIASFHPVDDGHR